STEDLTGVPAATYSVTVTATATGCTATASATVSNTNPPIGISGNVTPVSSCTLADGAVDVSTSPSGSYTYAWSNGAGTEDLTGVAAGTYTVTVSGAGTCTASASFTVTSTATPPAPSVNISPDTCAQGNGGLDLTVSPLGAYVFQWTNGATSEDLQYIGAGTYGVTITALASGCTTVASYAVPNFSTNFSLSGMTTPDTDCQLSNGSLDLTVTPSGDYVFLWSNGASSEDLADLAAGFYTVTVTSVIDGCVGEMGFTVAEELSIPVASAMAQPAHCGLLDGSVDLSVLPPAGYSFLWSNGGTTEDLSLVAAGVYTVTVTGADHCTATASAVVADMSTPILLSTAVTPHTSCLAPNGAVELSIAPAGTYDVLWSNGATTPKLQQVAAGTYSVTVTDSLGCMGTASVTVAGPVLPQVVVAGPASACQGQSAVISASGGFDSYLWSNGETGSSIELSQAGIYRVTATDANGCTATQQHMFKILPLPMPFINGPTAICGGTAVLSVTGGVFSQMQWSTGESGASIVVSQSGDYLVTVTSADGCTGSAVHKLELGSELLPSVATSVAYCAGSAVLDAGMGYASYLWSDGSTGQSLTVTSSGTYTLTVSDLTGCTGQTSVTVTLPAPPQVQIFGENSICQGGSTQLWVPSGYAQTLWST
ncbi:MAG TPA: hypothetical protein PK971_03900, partial [Saprospiraceae bacterium]|nr:hypothetical protein [Saprospiraceae bacterium]